MGFKWRDLVFGATRDDFIRHVKEYGVNARDDNHDRIVSHMYYMTHDKIDIIYEHGFRPYVKGVNYLYWPVIDKTPKSMWIVQKILENDTDGIYVRMKQYPGPAWSLGMCGTKLEEFEVHLKMRDDGKTLIMTYYANYDDIMIHYELLISHRNRHFTFFEHLQHLLEEKDINKKQRN